MAKCSITMQGKALRNAMGVYLKTVERKEKAEQSPLIKDILNGEIEELKTSIASIKEETK